MTVNGKSPLKTVLKFFLKDYSLRKEDNSAFSKKTSIECGGGTTPRSHAGSVTFGNSGDSEFSKYPQFPSLLLSLPTLPNQ